jgi:hypothetical protein
VTKHWATKVSKDHQLSEQQLSQRSKHGLDTTLEQLVYLELDWVVITVQTAESAVHQ